MDLNERIARLLEPVPVFDSEYGFSVGGAWLCHEGVHEGDFFDDSVTFDGEIKPLPFKESIDASMRVIEAKWESPTVTLYDGATPDEKCADLSVVEAVNSHGAAATYAEALALALCAALEAEVGK